MSGLPVSGQSTRALAMSHKCQHRTIAPDLPRGHRASASRLPRNAHLTKGSRADSVRCGCELNLHRGLAEVEIAAVAQFKAHHILHDPVKPSCIAKVSRSEAIREVAKDG
jgi:hypothetical protein